MYCACQSQGWIYQPDGRCLAVRSGSMDLPALFASLCFQATCTFKNDGQYSIPKESKWKVSLVQLQGRCAKGLQLLPTIQQSPLHPQDWPDMFSVSKTWRMAFQCCKKLADPEAMKGTPDIPDWTSSKSTQAEVLLFSSLWL